jgi:HD-GYP domain-containing protein (c-di-GMP phosphodiesterase class II)
MVLTLPFELPGLLALLATSIGHELRRRSNPDISPPEMLFNIGQSTLYTTAGALAFHATVDQAAGPEIAGLGSLGAVLIAAVVMHLVNTGAVAIAAGLQLNVNPIRVWWRSLALDAAPQVALAIVGLLAALIALQAWYLVPLLALPGILVQRAVQETIQLRIDTQAALAALVEVVELRDPYTAGHSRRVAASSRLIAQQLHLTEEEADLIESAGNVHDIGKVAVDPHVLLKTSKLTDEEWAQMQLHPVHGANVIDRFAAYRLGAKFVRHHHERWDGAGYPDRISGEDIPLGARILAVADSFDAMTSDRPYREGMPVERAVAILEEGSGVQWDPKVVEAFVAVVANRPDDVPVFRRQDVVPAAEPATTEPDAPSSDTEAA